MTDEHWRNDLSSDYHFNNIPTTADNADGKLVQKQFDKALALALIRNTYGKIRTRLSNEYFLPSAA